MLKGILWGLLGLLLLLFFCKTRVELLYLDGVTTVQLRLLHLFRLKLYPFKERPPKKHKARKRKEKPEKPPAEKPSKSREPVPLMDYVQTLCDLLPLLGRSISYWLRHTTIDRLWVRAVVHEEDAAETAIRCGQLSAVSHTLYAWCRPRMKIRQYSVNVLPNFIDGAEPLNLCLWVSASPAGMLWGMLLFLCRGGVALWRGPLVSQMLKKQPAAGQKDKKKASKKAAYKQIKDGVS